MSADGGESWFPLLSVESIYKHLAAEPHTMLPWEIDRLDRDTIFGAYLRPRKQKKPAPASPTYRQIFMAHGRRMGKGWLEIEGDWQRAGGA